MGSGEWRTLERAWKGPQEGLALGSGSWARSGLSLTPCEPRADMTFWDRLPAGEVGSDLRHDPTAGASRSHQGSRPSCALGACEGVMWLL